MSWIGLLLDVTLIAVVGIGVVQCVRLIRQLKGLRACRADMEQFVRDFNVSVMRAEAGVKGLRSTARETGDDLERLVDKAVKVRDELTFLVESADGIADRLSAAASAVIRTEAASASPASASPAAASSSGAKKAPEKRQPASGRADIAVKTSSMAKKIEALASSRAEQELIQALKKLG